MGGCSKDARGWTTHRWVPTMPLPKLKGGADEAPMNAGRRRRPRRMGGGGFLANASGAGMTPAVGDEDDGDEEGARRARRALETTLTEEPTTKLKLPSAMHGLELAGLGVRVKRITAIGVKVYACGIYFDVDALKRAMEEDVSTVDGLERSRACERSVRLVFARKVGGAQISSALAERIRPKLPQNSASLAEFEGIFAGLTFERGVSLDFRACPSGSLTTSIRGKPVSTIDDPRLADALFDAYIGSDPVIPELKSQASAFVAKLRA